jgi:hypothetical protein
MSAITPISTDPATRQDGQIMPRQGNFSRNVTPITEPLGAAVRVGLGLGAFDGDGHEKRSHGYADRFCVGRWLVVTALPCY